MLIGSESLESVTAASCVSLFRIGAVRGRSADHLAQVGEGLAPLVGLLGVVGTARGGLPPSGTVLGIAGRGRVSQPAKAVADAGTLFSA